MIVDKAFLKFDFDASGYIDCKDLERGYDAT